MDLQNDKEKLSQITNLMNDQSETPTMVTDDLLYVIDAALLPEEIDFLLKMGGGKISGRVAQERVDLPLEEFETRVTNVAPASRIAPWPPLL